MQLLNQVEGIVEAGPDGYAVRGTSLTPVSLLLERLLGAEVRLSAVSLSEPPVTHYLNTGTLSRVSDVDWCVGGDVVPFRRMIGLGVRLTVTPSPSALRERAEGIVALLRKFRGVG